MNTVKYQINDSEIIRQVPSNWNELTLDQVLFICPRIMLQDKTDDLVTEIVIYLFGIKGIISKMMNLSQLDALKPAIDFLFEPPDLTVNKLKVINIRQKKYQGPDDEMKDITVSQFAFANRFMEAFLKSKQEDFLNLMISSLYYPAKKQFVKEDIEKNAEKLKRLKLNQKTVILAFYMGSLLMLSKRFPGIFSSKKSYGKRKNGWLGFFYELAGPKIGNYKEVADMNLYEMFGVMKKINEDARETEKQLKRKR